MKGHIRKREGPRGTTWSFVYDAPPDPETGKRRQRWRSGFATKREAQAELASILTKLNNQSYVLPSRVTVGEWLGTWLAGHHNIRPSTRAAYEVMVRVHAIPHIGGIKLQALTPGHLNALYAELLAHGGMQRKGVQRRGRPETTGKPLSPRTVHYVHSTIHTALRAAVKQGILSRNVAELADPPKSVKREMATWTGAELLQFLTFVEGERLAVAYRVLAMTGLRRGELLGVRWQDVDLDAGTLAVRQTVTSVGTAILFSTPKTDRGTRMIDLDPRDAEALRQHRAAQLAERMELGLGRPEPSALVFAQPDGAPLNPGLFSDRFNRLVKAAGLPPIRVHDLRHSHASLGLASGVPAKVMANRLGHSSVSITLDTYSHVLPQQSKEAASRIADLVFGEQVG